MATWCRAVLEQRCGGCGAVIAIGHPMLVVELAGVKRRLFRCTTCRGPAPPELPDRIEMRPPDPLPFERLGLLPLNFSRRRDHS